jgi:hypothetical protein
MRQSYFDNFRMTLVEVIGKQYRRVPVLLSPTMVKAIQALEDRREEGCVKSSNPYIFAQVRVTVL